MADIVSDHPQWALYVYFGANVPEAEVQEAAVRNLLQMATVGSSKDVVVAAQLHLPGRWAYRYVMPQRPPGSYPEPLAPVNVIPNCNSADPKTIREFFRWAAQKCPARQTMLVVWGHGYGIDDYLPRGSRPFPGNADTKFADDDCLPKKTRPDKCSESEEEEERAEFVNRVADSRYGLMNAVNVIEDECSLNVLPNRLLGTAMKDCAKQLPDRRELSILALDACIMGMAEVWCEMGQSARIGIASEAQEPDGSFPYDRILARMMLQPHAAPEDVAKMVVDAYVESYAYLSDTFVTLSACNLMLIPSLETAIKTLVGQLIRASKDPQKRRAIFKARNDSPIFDPDGFIDLGRFCEILQIVLPDKGVSGAAQGVLDAIQGSADGQKKPFVEYARYSPLDPMLRISQTMGLSVWFPPWLEDPFVDVPEKEASIAYLINGYDYTRFSCNTCWGTFLRAMWYTRSNCPDFEPSLLADGDGQLEKQQVQAEKETNGKKQRRSDGRIRQRQ